MNKIKYIYNTNLNRYISILLICIILILPFSNFIYSLLPILLFNNISIRLYFIYPISNIPNALYSSNAILYILILLNINIYFITDYSNTKSTLLNEHI